VLNSSVTIPDVKFITDWVNRISTFKIWSAYTTTYDLGKVIGWLGKEHEEVKRAGIELINAQPHGGPSGESSVGVFIVAAGWNNDPEVARMLQHIANSEDFYFSQEAAVTALAEYFTDDPRTLDCFLELAGHPISTGDSRSPYAREKAVKALVEHYRDDPRVIALMVALVKNDSDGVVRDYAARLVMSGDDGTTISPL
jgi:hypothetical protein